MHYSKVCSIYILFYKIFSFVFTISFLDGVGPRVIKKLRKARTELNASEFCHLMLETGNDLLSPPRYFLR